MIRFRALPIAAGYVDANDCDALRADPAFRLAAGRLPERRRNSRWIAVRGETAYTHHGAPKWRGGE